MLLGIGAGQWACAQLSLHDAIKFAESHRQSVLAANARVRSAYATRSQLSAYPATVLEFGDGTTPDYTAGGEDFLIAQPLDLYGRVSAGRASGQSQVDAAQASLLQAQVDVQTQVVQAYTQAYSDQALVITAQQISDIANQVYEATQKRVDAGDLAPAQLLQADLERERAKQTLEVRRLGSKGSMARLQAALGLDPSSASSVNTSSDSLTLVVSGKGSWKDRPDIKAAQADVASANADVRISDLQAYPDVQLEFRRAPWQTSESYAFRAQIVWPIWDHGLAHNRSKASKELRDAAQHTLDDRRRQAEAEIYATKQDYEAALAAVKSYAKLEEDANALLKKQQRGYQLGAATLLDVLDVTRSLREIEEGAIDARVKLALASSSLLAAKGEVIR